MANKKLDARIPQKHDTEANWNKAVNFKPMVGEFIVYDPDANYSYARFKIGDGNTVVKDLPFVGVLNPAIPNSIIGVWVLNDTLTKIDADSTQGQVEIDCVGYAPRREQFSKISFIGGEEYWYIELYLSEANQYIEFYSSTLGFSDVFEEKVLVFLEEIEDVAFVDWLRANATKMLLSIEPGLETVNKTIVEAINEVNSSIANIPTVDNIEYMDFTGEGTEIYIEDVGIMWDVESADISSMAGPFAYFRVPIAAGEGIEFIPGEEGQIVNIGLNEETREAIANVSIELDTTLTQSNKAADAKAVGDALEDKVDKVEGKGLSANDFTNEYKNKLDNLSTTIQEMIEAYVDEAILGGEW